MGTDKTGGRRSSLVQAARRRYSQIQLTYKQQRLHSTKKNRVFALHTTSPIERFKPPSESSRRVPAIDKFLSSHRHSFEGRRVHETTSGAKGRVFKANAIAQTPFYRLLQIDIYQAAKSVRIRVIFGLTLVISAVLLIGWRSCEGWYTECTAWDAPEVVLVCSCATLLCVASITVCIDVTSTNRLLNALMQQAKEFPEPNIAIGALMSTVTGRVSHRMHGVAGWASLAAANAVVAGLLTASGNHSWGLMLGLWGTTAALAIWTSLTILQNIWAEDKIRSDKAGQLRELMKEFYDAGETELLYVELDEETLQMHVHNPIDPRIRTLAHYLAVNATSHPDDDERNALLQYSTRFAKRFRPSKSIDFFVSHAWADDVLHPHKPLDVLLDLNEAFKRTFGRPVRLWLDKLCLIAERVITVQVVRARNLPEMDADHGCDAFVCVSLNKETCKTPVVYDNLNPQFSCSFDFDAVWPANTTGQEQQLKCEVKDKDFMSSEFMGQFEVNLSNLKVLDERRAWYTLCDAKNQEDDTLGEVELIVRCSLRRGSDLAELLPICIANCTSCLCMYSADWRKRLWCISEVTNRALLCAPDAHVPLLIYDIDNSFPSANADVPILDAQLATCTNPGDEEMLHNAILAMPGGGRAPFSHFSQHADGELSNFAACVIKY